MDNKQTEPPVINENSPKPVFKQSITSKLDKDSSFKSNRDENKPTFEELHTDTLP